MIVGFSVDVARPDLLSLWRGPFGGRQLASEQESLAQAAFFDVAEAAHEVPRTYANGFHVAFGCHPPVAPPAAARDIRVEPWRSSTAAPSTSTSTSSMASAAAPSTASAAPSTSA